MRDAEGLVQVEMRHIRAIISRTTQTHLEGKLKCATCRYHVKQVTEQAD